MTPTKTFRIASGLGAVAALGLMAFSPSDADASTILNTESTGIDGFVVDQEYFAQGADARDCACLSWWHTFQFNDYPADTVFNVTAVNGVINRMTNPRIQWIEGNGLGGTVLADEPLLTGVGSGNANLFLGFAQGDEVTAAFVWDALSFTNPENPDAAPFSFAVTVTSIPVPAAGWLLLTAVGGLAVASRRRKAA